MSVIYVSACALIDQDGRVLIAQRPKEKPFADLWEFPGGKIELGETPENAAIRELREELSVEPCPTCLQSFAFVSQTIASGQHVVIMLFVCRRWDGFIKVNEHQNIAWVRPEHLSKYTLVPADKPLAAELRDRLVGSRVT